MNINSTPSTTGFWSAWLTTNQEHAIYHQWEQLEASGCIDNFRILAGEKDTFREGWFFADSDAYKWLDAAARIYPFNPDPKLFQLMDDFILLLQKCQSPDGYLYTYNQLLFPETRWLNLQIEHELYCHGHLIEAGISHYQATGSQVLLDIARKAADQIVADFSGKTADYTPGHEEIEIALLRLYEATAHTPYLDMAKQFLALRGTNKHFSLDILRQFISVGDREKSVQLRRKNYQEAHPEEKNTRVPEGNFSKKPKWIKLRWYLNSLSGKYFQQHQPLNKQDVPVGHSVRFAYLQTAAAMLDRMSATPTYQSILEKSWERMVQRRMYITGGIGSLPEMEGFGRDYELDPEFAYAETCAALGSIFWNWEMAKLTGKAQYSDLLEWQLYNAALVGMGQNGQCYFYNNPLASHGGIQRRAWYAVPCCPSNLSRTWASLHNYVVSAAGNVISIHQYIDSKHHITDEKTGTTAEIQIKSKLPWDGKVQIQLNTPTESSLILKLRIPSWAEHIHLTINNEEATQLSTPPKETLDPQHSKWLELERTWLDGDQMEITFDLAVNLLHTDPRVKGHQGKVALARGPIIYCLESCDQPDLNLFEAILDLASITTEERHDLLRGFVAIKAASIQGHPLTFIPYHLWGNRGESQMSVWVNYKE